MPKKLFKCVNEIDEEARRVGYAILTVGASICSGVGVSSYVEAGVAYGLLDGPIAQFSQPRGYVSIGKGGGFVAGTGIYMVIGVSNGSPADVEVRGKSVAGGIGLFVKSAWVALNFVENSKF